MSNAAIIHNGIPSSFRFFLEYFRGFGLVTFVKMLSAKKPLNLIVSFVSFFDECMLRDREKGKK